MYLLIKTVNVVLRIIEIMILIDVLLSWVVRNPDNPLRRMLGLFLDPLYVPIRRLMDKLGLNMGMIDFTPMIAMLALGLIRKLVINLLIMLL